MVGFMMNCVVVVVGFWLLLLFVFRLRYVLMCCDSLILSGYECVILIVDGFVDYNVDVGV